MRLLVAGGCGFIGSHFVRYWLDTHPEDVLTNLDALTYAGDPANLADVARQNARRYRFVRGDIADAQAVDAALRSAAPEIVVNFAAASHNSRAIREPDVFVRTNVVGTQTLLEAARRHGTRRFHQISTCEVYGDLPLDSAESFDERSPYRPRTPYNASKAAADHLVRAYHASFGLGVTISISANTYGPNQHPEKLIARFASHALLDRPLPLYRHSDHRREWVHVQDHVRAVADIVERGRVGETYHVGTGEERSIEEVADAVLAALSKPASLKTYVADRPGHDRRYLLDHTKISRELGWSARIAFAAGIQATAGWYRDNRAWWEPKVAQLDAELDETGWERIRPA